MAFNISSVFGLGNTMPAMASILKPGANKEEIISGILDLVFRDSALIMKQTGLLFSPNAISTIPLPLLGFSFQTPDEVEILNYEFSEYPYLNRSTVANAFLKAPCTLRCVGLRPIYKENPLLLNYVLNNLSIPFYIERYCDRGGTWALNTMWGYFDDLVLTNLKGIKLNETETGGIGFEFTFKKLQLSNLDTAESLLSNAVGQLGVC